MMLRSPLFLLCLITSTLSTAQNTPISGIVNRYAAVTGIDTCQGLLYISDTSGFAKNDVVLLIQMQGAEIASGNNSAFGTIQVMHAAGYYERAVIDSVGAGVISLTQQLVHSYQMAGKVQVVRIATYTSAMVMDTVFAKPWDGTTGGIVALEVSNTLTLNAPVMADGAGFRGGLAAVVPGNNCNFLIPEAAYYYAANNWRGSRKGEGIALIETGKELGRGAQANGGGGGNDHNAGGGGGGHIGRGGGGGENDEPSSFGCDGYFPGKGGNPVQDTAFRLFPGGGGGAGHANNTLNGSGANGGGILMIRAAALAGSQPILSANGKNAALADGDGGGGGGAGGTIWLETNVAPPNLQLFANGGRGGNTSNNNGNRCFGPGGGGAGGRILSNLNGINIPSGAAAGIVTNSSGSCNGASNNAGTGENGWVETLPVFPQGTLALQPQILLSPQLDTVCIGQPALFYAQTNAGNWQTHWQLSNDGINWQDIQAGTGYTGFQGDTLLVNPALSTQNGLFYRIQLERTGCYEVFSSPAQLTVLDTPVADFTASIDTQTVTFNNLSLYANAYQWSFGDGTMSHEINPQHSYSTGGTYTVTLQAFNACDTVNITQDIVILLLPMADFSVPQTVIDCGPTELSFHNLSSANSSSFQWLFPGGAPESSTEINPVVLYSSSGMYTATLIVGNNAGFDTTLHMIEVEILNFPVASFTSTLLPGGLLQGANTSLGGSSFTWDFGDGSALVVADDMVSHQYLSSGNYTVTLIASNACGASVFQMNVVVDLQSVGIGQINRSDAIDLFPNPFNQYLVIDCSRLGVPPDRLDITDMLGKIVWQQTGFTALQTTLSLQDLPVGMYVVRLRLGAWVKQQLMVKSF